MCFSVESVEMQRRLFFLQIRMAKETLAINRNMPMKSTSTTARKVCHWSVLKLHLVLLCQKRKGKKGGGSGRDSAKYHILVNLASWGKT